MCPDDLNSPPVLNGFLHLCFYVLTKHNYKEKNPQLFSCVVIHVKAVTIMIDNKIHEISLQNSITKLIIDML